jgi:hypothetical protein
MSPKISSTQKTLKAKVAPMDTKTARMRLP